MRVRVSYSFLYPQGSNQPPTSPFPVSPTKQQSTGSCRRSACALQTHTRITALPQPGSQSSICSIIIHKENLSAQSQYFLVKHFIDGLVVTAAARCGCEAANSESYFELLFPSISTVNKLRWSARQPLLEIYSLQYLNCPL